MENIVIRKITCNEVESAMNLALEVFMQFEEICCIYEKEHDIHVIRLNDGDGVFIDGDVHICQS